MAKIEVSRPHGLSPAEAKQKTEILVDQLQVKYKLKGSWQTEDRYQFKATGAKGEGAFGRWRYVCPREAFSG